MLKYAFMDIDTQFDFMVPEGKLYVPGAVDLIPGIARLAHFIGKNKLAVCGSYDWHVKDDPEFKRFPEHCVKFTTGAMPLMDIEGEKMAYFEKTTPDIFSNKKADGIIKEVAESYIVFGVATDICIKYVVDGLLERGKHVVLIIDLIKGIDKKKSTELVNGWVMRGVATTTLEDMLKNNPDELKEVVEEKKGE